MNVSATPRPPQKPPVEEKESYLSARVKTIGGLVAVGMGVFAVAATAIVAIAVDNDDAATIASAAGGVIATIVGAYFGVKAGNDRAKAAGDDQKAESAKAQVYALHLDPDKATQVQKDAETAVAQAVSE
ncbi:MAG TPA: hypothetical protein VJU14_01740 [Solirubrobacterales bacterium]|nr:hypothetical protein [Solirubrobacterales bacterium]